MLDNVDEHVRCSTNDCPKAARPPLGNHVWTLEHVQQHYPTSQQTRTLLPCPLHERYLLKHMVLHEMAPRKSPQRAPYQQQQPFPLPYQPIFPDRPLVGDLIVLFRLNNSERQHWVCCYRSDTLGKSRELCLTDKIFWVLASSLSKTYNV